MTSQDILNKLIKAEHLDRDEAAYLMRSVMTGEMSHPRTAAVLTALRMKGETVDEIAGFVSVMRERALRITPARKDVIDTCGTGGDGRHTFNISTATAIVAAGMGIPVAKHGNRAISSKCGSADVLEALGVNLDLTPESAATLIDEVGICFLFAPAHHPAMKHVAPIRKDLAIRTIFNLLGPLTNPAGVKRQLIGVFKKELTVLVARVLQTLGSEKVFVVHGLDGTDEASIGGETIASCLENGRVHTTTFVPEDAGLKRADVSDLSGGSAGENAKHILDILDGRKGPRRDAVVFNSAFVAVIADRAKTLYEGARLAEKSIDSGEAFDILNTLRERSHAMGNGRKTGLRS